MRISSCMSCAGCGITITSKIPECQGSLALHLERGTIHECDKTGDQFRLSLGKFLAVHAIDGDIAECRSAVILYVRVHRV